MERGAGVERAFGGFENWSLRNCALYVNNILDGRFPAGRGIMSLYVVRIV